jgi:hypothetical protein
MVKMDLKEIGCKVVDCIQLDPDKGQWRALVMKLRIP